MAVPQKQTTTKAHPAETLDKVTSTSTQPTNPRPKRVRSLAGIGIESTGKVSPDVRKSKVRRIYSYQRSEVIEPGQPVPRKQRAKSGLSVGSVDNGTVEKGMEESIPEGNLGQSENMAEDGYFSDAEDLQPMEEEQDLEEGHSRLQKGLLLLGWKDDDSEVQASDKQFEHTWDKVDMEWYTGRDRKDFSSVGGPKNDAHLYEFSDHVARYVAEGKPRQRPLRIIHHGHAFERPDHRLGNTQWWDFKEEENEAFKQHIKNSGLFHLIEYHPRYYNAPLIEALVERWQPETNTFHLPQGELTILLSDVEKILGLKIDGIPLLETGEASISSTRQLASDALGLNIETHGFMFHGEGDIKLTVLMEHFKGRLKEDSEEVLIEQTVRAYILYVLGMTIFSNKSGGTRVSVQYLASLLDISEISKLAFGTSYLAYQYYRLGEATRYKRKQLAGYAPLIEIWSYLYFPHLRHEELVVSKDGESESTYPQMKRFKIYRQAQKATHRALKRYRRKLNELKADQIKWAPYGEATIPEVAYYRGVIACPLHIQEIHQPDRVSRQLGKPFHIPGLPIISMLPRQLGAYLTTQSVLVNWAVEWKNYVFTDFNPVSEDEYKKWLLEYSRGELTQPGHDAELRDDLKKWLLSVRKNWRGVFKAFADVLRVEPMVAGRLGIILDKLKGKKAVATDTRGDTVEEEDEEDKEEEGEEQADDGIPDDMPLSCW